MKNTIEVGSYVRKTGVFLRNTGQLAGSDTVWRVIACDCGLCRDGYIATDEKSAFGGQLHILRANVELTPPKLDP